MLVQFPNIFLYKPSQTPQSVVDATATTQSRSSTTITMLEEELGVREPRKSGLLSKLKIPKRKMSTTQAPELRRTPSFYEGSRVTLWDCDEDDVNFPQSPLEDVSFPPRSSPDYDAVGERDSELGQDVATPMNGTAWSSDEELTPLFSSNFPRTPHPNALRGESHSDGELLEISTPSPIRPDTP